MSKQIKVGDSVKLKGGKPGKVVQVTAQAALVESGKGESFQSSWYALESLGGTARQAESSEAEGDE